jgi:hypothetical protein
MTDWIRKALTKTKQQHGSHLAIAEPNDRLVYGVKFAMTMTFSLTALQVAHLLILRSWNSEIFSAITGLAGTITGIFISQKA